MKLFCSNYWQNPKITAAVHYFHYNSHHHYHYHHFHYHWKMHFDHLKILLTILFRVIWSPVVSIIFCLLFTGIYFSLVLFLAFRFVHPVKRLRISLQPSDMFKILSLYPFIYIYSYLHFLIYTHLLILIYTYLSILMLSLYYYMNLIKLINMGNIEITTKFSRLKECF